MKFTILTPTYNSQKFLVDSLLSTTKQSYNDIEILMMDGCSSDRTLQIAQKFHEVNVKIYSEPDQGIYDALNKGIARANGDVIGIVHSDDYLADHNVILDVYNLFKISNCDFVYSNLEMIKGLRQKQIHRTWIACDHNKLNASNCWRIPHPTLFVKKSVINTIGYYDTNLRISADYDFLIRLVKHNFKGQHLNRCTYKMRYGGISTDPINTGRILVEDIRVIRKNKLQLLPVLTSKKLSKISQLIGK